MRQRVKAIVASVFILAVVTAYCGFALGVNSAQNVFAQKESLGKLTVLMYHNTLAPNKKECVYCINQNHLRQDFQYLRDNGYKVLSCAEIIRTVKRGKKLPDKAVMLTFDDGYLNNLKYALPLLKEFDYTGLFSVVGDYTRLDRHNKKSGGDFVYFGWEDIADANACNNIEIGLHSYSMHNTKPRLGVAKLRGESNESYKKVFSEDTDKLIKSLADKGVFTDIYAYPYGKYTKESEQVLKDKGIIMTLTCNEGVNTIYSEQSLYLMRRFNRDATKDSLSEIIGRA